MKYILFLFIIHLNYTVNISTKGISINSYTNTHSIKPDFVTHTQINNSNTNHSLLLENITHYNPQEIPIEKELAIRIVNDYRKIFNYLDYDPINEQLTAKELAVAFDEFDWPKLDLSETDNIKYCNNIINKYDSELKGTINFVEFVRFMEDMWDNSDKIREQEYIEAINQAKTVFSELFHWLDRDNDEYINKEDILYGLSRVLLKDVNRDEIDKVFEIYDVKKIGKINMNEFILSIEKGLFDKTFKDEDFNESFF